MKQSLPFLPKSLRALLLKIFLIGTIPLAGFLAPASAQSITMANGTLSNVCSGTFYDPGGMGGLCATNSAVGNYNNGLNITETFIPAAGNKIRFVFNASFCVENNYDFLYIYNGNSAGAPLIGTYTGTVSPGTINSTAADGSLTFRFTSDVTLRQMGWSAVISCVPVAAPVISNFTPASGCATTSSITINGTNLSGAISVTIGGTPVSSITSNTSTQIVAGVGSGTSGTIAVTTPGGTAYSALSFTVNPLPNAYNVTGGGTYCSGGSGQSIGLVNSQAGFSYQLYNGATPAGPALTGTGSSLNFGLQTGAGNYTVIATNPFSNCTKTQTGSAVISVNTAPVITSNPASAVKCTGASVSFSVTATGSPLTYQWRKNGVNITGATTYIYTIPSVAAGDAAGYDVIVSVASCSPVNSSTATLTVNPLPGLFTVTGGGTYCNGGAGVPVNLSGSEPGINYTLSPGSIVMPGTGSAISFGNQTMASVYAVSAQNTTTGCSRAMSGSAVIIISNVPVITGQPTDKIVCTGASVSFSVTATGSGLAYQWRKGLVNIINGGTISGATTAVLNISAAAAGDAATDYNCEVSNACGTVISNYVSLTVNTAGVAPTSQPTALIFPTVSITSIIGSFTQSSTATNYLVVRRTNPTPPNNPVNGTNYAIGSAVLGAGTYVEYTGTSNVFTSNGLNPGTTYYFWVYAFNLNSCGTSPLYFTTGALNGSVTTATNVNCGTVTPFYWAGNGSAFTNPVKSSDFNTPSNWSLTTPSYSASPVSPSACNDINIVCGTGVIITLSANASVYNMNYMASGSSTVALSTQGRTLEINGNAVIDISSGSPIIAIGENSAGSGIIDFKANVNIGINPAGIFTGRTSYFIGNSSSKLIFRGDLTLGRTCAIPTAQTPGTIEFDGGGLQQILWNNDLYFANFRNVVVGNINNPIVRHVTGTYTPDNILNNLTINGSSVLDLASSQWIRNTSGGVFALNGSSKLILGGDKSLPINGGVVVPGSNFPGGFSTMNISAGSTVEYNGPNSITQTVYSTPVYGSLVLTNGTGTGIASKISTGNITITGIGNVKAGVTMTMGGNIAVNNLFNVNSGSVLQCGTYFVSGSGEFRLLAGGTLGMASPQGISTLPGTGNIQSVNKSFSTGANYIYNGTGALATGNALPTLVNDLTIANTSGITLYAASANYTVTGILKLTAGPFIINGNNLTINSLTRSSGTFMGSPSSGITVKGTSIPLFFATGGMILKDLALGTNASASLNTTLDITAGSNAGSVAVAGGATLTTNNNLTLKSNALGTSRVAEIPVNGSGAATGFITGNVTVERYISAQRAWRFLAVPTAGPQTIHSGWQENQPQGNNTLIGKGIQITGATFPANGFDAYSASPSMKTWSGTSYTGISGTNIPIATDKGYMTFIRGDRTINYYTTTLSPATTLRTSGTLKTGKYPAVAMPLVAGEMTAVGNPYASAIDFNKVVRTGGTPNTFYVWDPKLTTGPSSSYGFGGFRTITWDNVTSSYVITPSGGSYSSGNTAIESGEAFFVVAPLTSGSVSFPESCKVSGSNLVTRPGDNTGTQLRTNLYVISSGTNVLIDGALAQYHGDYSNSIDELDAVKFANTGENFGIKRENKIYAVERRNILLSADTIFFNLAQLRQQQYSFEFIADNLNEPGREAFLEDSYLQTRTAISLEDTTHVNFNVVTSAAGSLAADRFRIVFTAPLGPLPVSITDISATRTSEKFISVDWKVENEISMENYEVERSADARIFTKINTTAARINNGGSAGYSFGDAKPLDGINFYRIKAVSRSGKVQYSAIVKVAPEKTPAGISVYPNPVVNKTINIQFTNTSAGEYLIHITNTMGQVVYKNRINVNSGNTVKSVPLGKAVSSGNYQLSITAEDGVKNIQQVTVQ